jgi:hypothetical protein
MKSPVLVTWILLAGLGLAGCAPASSPAPQEQAPAAIETSVSTPAAQVQASATLEFIGHSCFLLTASDGTRIVLDPYKDYTPAREIQMFPKGIAADAVVITHFHPDHTNSDAIAGARLIYQAGTDSVGSFSRRDSPPWKTPMW